MGFSKQEYWSGLPFPSLGDLPNPGIEAGSPALQADSLPTELQGKPTKLPASYPGLIHMVPSTTIANVNFSFKFSISFCIVFASFPLAKSSHMG